MLAPLHISSRKMRHIYIRIKLLNTEKKLQNVSFTSTLLGFILFRKLQYSLFLDARGLRA